MRTKRIALLLPLLVALGATAMSAATLGVDFSSPGSQNSQSVWSLGYKFVANNNVSVVGLGVFDYAQDGLVGDQQVGLWDASQTLLASTYVTNSDALQGFWRFHAITPVQLTAGNTYYVASQGGEGYTYFVNGLVVAPDITFVVDAWHYIGSTTNNPLYFPDSTDNFGLGVGGGFFGGNIQLGAVPEPASLLLLGTGLIGLGAWRKRR